MKRVYKECPRCHGDKWERDPQTEKKAACKRCAGTGELVWWLHDDDPIPEGVTVSRA